MAKKKVGLWDFWTKDNEYINGASVCNTCGKEFIALKNKYGKRDFKRCDYCKNDFDEHMRVYKDRKKEEMKSMYNQNYYHITEIKVCELCSREFRTNVNNHDVCDMCTRAEEQRKKKSYKAWKNSFWEQKKIYQCSCMDCGIEFTTKEIGDRYRCEACKEERNIHKNNYQGRAKDTDFKCINCGEFFKADGNKYFCPKCLETKEKNENIEKIVNCKECGVEFVSKCSDDILCYKCFETNRNDIDVCGDCGAELFWGQACNCKNKN